MKKIKVTQELVNSLADLAKLNFNNQESEQIKSDLEKMLEFVNTISQINTDGVEPLVYINEEKSLLRNDEINNELTQNESLKNAPSKDSDYFKDPTVLKK